MRVTVIRSALAFTAVVSLATSALAQQSGARAGQSSAQRPAVDDATPAPAQSRKSANERTALPQGFSVVLVLGDIQAATTSDDVPPAARKALNDMKEFLPFKSYKLLDAAWLMCCGQDFRNNFNRNPSMMANRSSFTQMLRGPEDREYELELAASRTETSSVFVKFTLSAPSTVDTSAAEVRTLERRLADLKDTRAMLDKQLQDAKKKVEVGVSSGSDVPKMELEVRRVDRDVEELNARLAEVRAGRATTPRPSGDRSQRNAVIDTSFSMDVGETVVVGTSRLKGGSKALIALLTAVPPRTGERRE